jgi:hypothetical protein
LSTMATLHDHDQTFPSKLSRELVDSNGTKLK